MCMEGIRCVQAVQVQPIGCVPAERHAVQTEVVAPKNENNGGDAVS
jgi:hypothetical protein